MSSIYTYLAITCFSLFGLLVVKEAIRNHSRMWIAELVAAIFGFGLLHWTTGFPAIVISFSSVPPVLPIIVTLVGVVLGMIASYFFYLKERFSWLAFLKPLAVSPLVVLPLVGIVQNQRDIEANQLIYVFLVSFQNGFFWKLVFKNVRPKIK
jgi:hypothetical protein